MVFVLLVYTKKKGTLAKLYSRNTASTEWERSPYTHTIRAQNRFKLTQNNFYLYHSAVRSGVVTDTIIRAWCVIVKSVRPHEEVLKNDVLSLDIRERTFGYGPCCIPLKGPFQWQIRHLLQCKLQRSDVRGKKASPFQGGDRAKSTACDHKGGYDITLSNWTLLFRLTLDRCIPFGNVGDVAVTSAQRQGTHTMGQLTLRPFYKRSFERTSSRPLNWPWITNDSGTINMATT